ncbi:MULTISPECIES: O-antigen ligase family protein [Pseudomonas]|uniref:O-antigen ligase family protein n=1 Tax=Pseudomonas folii TaxID=2762593 RepID=A0ABR7B0U5_9PSED|nr:MULTISPECIES: O-antigen ligase family protein [Pseudomonas]MBC3950774.1 O-antigen ligase family protein [Pseudomonas folii]
MKRLVGKASLAGWASIGFFILLCAPWVLPENKLYHQLIIFSLWLPALLAVFRQSVRPLVKLPEVFFFVVFSIWTLFVLIVEGSDEPGKGKIVLYVTLTLLGVLLAAQYAKWRLESLLLCSSVIGGIFAAVSVICFYSAPQASGGRIIALGLWDTVIMAAHAVGALAILGIFMLQTRRFSWTTLSLLLIPAAGYLMFLCLSQTRGVWIALVAAMIVMVIARPSRLGVGVIALMVISVVGVAAFDVELLLQRGVSFRPALWTGGIQLIEQHWATGLGFHEYLITVPVAGSFKHPHNLFLDTGVRLGLPGLLIFSSLWLTVGWRGWISRVEPLGQALLALWVFSSVSLMTDGIGLWLKPNADWLITWVPVCLSIVLAYRSTSVEALEPAKPARPIL